MSYETTQGSSRPPLSLRKDRSVTCALGAWALSLALLFTGCKEDETVEALPCFGACVGGTVCVEGRCIIPDAAIVPDEGVMDAAVAPPDAVIDAPYSIAIDEAANRLHVQKALMHQLLTVHNPTQQVRP